MTLIKTSILSLIATFFKMLSGLVINKAISVYIGPAGLAIIGQFQSFSQVVLIAAQGAINSGVVKYTAEYGEKSHKLPILFSTAGKISLASSIIVGITLISFSTIFSEKILANPQFKFIFIIFGLTIILFVLNGLLLSILNGLKEIRDYIKINITQSIYALIFTSILVISFGLNGALIALTTNQSVILIITLFLLRKHPLIKWKYFIGGFNKTIAKKLMAYSAMAITSAIMVPLSHLIIRNYLGSTVGWNQAGYWQGIFYISSTYLIVITTALSTYYLPRLSEIDNNSELIREIKNGYKLIIPIAIGCALLIFSLRDQIIELLFTNDFIEMRSLFLWQLIGDIFKIASWLLSYIMLAKAMTKIFIFTEIIFGILFLIASYYLVDKYGLIGMSYAYFMQYFMYFLCMVYIMYFYLRRNQ
ncbi:O-antigen translocase [Xenorhabdus bharatensis]|uniref:O-antigen translocase n=1 Tax=Xenorhabdus bharatensis TaxID=3136256 RepID=UPI0030F492C0